MNCEPCGLPVGEHYYQEEALQRSTECARLLAILPGKVQAQEQEADQTGEVGSIKIRQKSRNSEFSIDAQHQEGGDSDSEKGRRYISDNILWWRITLDFYLFLSLSYC